MYFDYVLDLVIQYFLKEVLESFITNTSNFLTRLVSCLTKKNIQTSKSFHSHIDVLYQSDHFLVLNKPPDLLVNSDDMTQNTVQTILRNQLPGLRNPNLKHEFYFAHRLDFSTSGILCIPLHKKACVSLCKSFEQRKCEKFYIGIVNGHMKQEICDVNFPIGEDSRYELTSKRMCTARLGKFCKNPRKAQTRVLVLARGTYYDLHITKVLLQPITGRRHQLRLHCSALGHPILGDYTYGTEVDKKLSRMYLHAIRIIAPNDAENLHIETEDPFTDDNFTFTGELTPFDGVTMLRKKQT